MSKAIVAARPSIESALAAGHQPTRQSRKQRRPKTDASIKALPRPRPASIIPPLGCLVSPRLTRRSHPDCRAIPYFETTTLEALSDPNQVYQLEARLRKFGVIDQGEVERFAATYFKGPLVSADRIALEALVRNAVARFEAEDDEGQQEEFRQLLKSFMRFYSFVAQVVRLADTSLEKLYAYASWLTRLLPNREEPPDIEITEDMLRLQAFRVEQKEEGRASVTPGDRQPLTAISEFAAKPYTEDEEKTLSEIVKSFNDRHGTQFAKEDFLRFEQVNREILDEDMSEMLRNNPPDVVYSAFSHAFFQGAIRLFQRENRLQDIVMTDPEVRNQAIRHFFNRALREVRDEPRSSPA